MRFLSAWADAGAWTVSECAANAVVTIGRHRPGARRTGHSSQLRETGFGLAGRNLWPSAADGVLAICDSRRVEGTRAAGNPLQAVV